MSDPKPAFDQAVIDSRSLPEKPDNPTLLKLYAFFKQATDGDVQGERPGAMDFVNRAKWDAWHALQGRSTDDAMRDYAELVESLK